MKIASIVVTIIVCLIGFLYSFGEAYYAYVNAQSIMHQMYSGIYALIATIFLCTSLIVWAVSCIKIN